MLIWYKLHPSPKRDVTPVSPEIFNGTHNMEGKFGIRVDPDVLRERWECESVNEKRNQVKHVDDQGTVTTNERTAQKRDWGRIKERGG
jgi:hypothetical protein